MQVFLIGYYGGDITHAMSAWTSTSASFDRTRMIKLLKMLAKENHGTPFEKSMLHFNVTTDIATHIQLLKHRIGVSINGESARYKELKEDKYYIPDDWPEKWKNKLETLTEQTNALYHECLKDLTPILGRDRAKESARFFKNYNSMINVDISFNWRSFYHFYILRNSPHAQKEIRILSDLMLEKIKAIEGNPFEITIDAFGL